MSGIPSLSKKDNRHSFIDDITTNRYWGDIMTLPTDQRTQISSAEDLYPRYENTVEYTLERLDIPENHQMEKLQKKPESWDSFLRRVLNEEESDRT